LIVTALLSVAAGLTLPAPGGASAAIGRACSHVFGPPCPAGQFCDFGGGTCGATIGFGGTCTVVPRVCPLFVRPVCGCNGKTYGNDCMREKAKVSKLHDGRC